MADRFKKENRLACIEDRLSVLESTTTTSGGLPVSNFTHEHFADQFIVTNTTQTDYILSEYPTKPSHVIVEYDNHELMYGIGFTIADNVLSLLINSDWQLENGEPIHVKYYVDR